eukprot:6191049-Pleurochrysis_carterae.AAC.1
MVWRQLGRHAGELRVQMKLAPATGGYVVTAVRVTVPSALKHAGSTPASADSAANGTCKNNAANRLGVSGAETDQASGANSTAAAKGSDEEAPGQAVPPAEALQASEAVRERARERVRAAEVAVEAAAMEVAQLSLEAKRASAAAAAASDRAAKLAAALDENDDYSPIRDVTDETDEADKAAEAAKIAKEEAAACARRLRDANARADAARAALSEVKAEQVSGGDVRLAPVVTAQPAQAVNPASATAEVTAQAQAPAGKTADTESKAHEGFMSCSAFQGTRQGYVFKMGADGLGYYRDTARETHAPRKVPTSVAAAAPKTAADTSASTTTTAASVATMVASAPTPAATNGTAA